MIPRVIHMLWLQGEDDLRARKPDLAQILDHNRKHAAAASPSWQVRVWSEDDVMQEAMPKLERALREVGAPSEKLTLAPVLASCPSHAARSDILRLVVLATEGGLYLDTDMMLLSDSFEWMLQDSSLVLAHDTSMTRADAWLYGSRGSNCFLAASPRHAFVLEALQTIAAAKPYPKRGDAFPDTSSAARKWTLRTTGPYMLEQLLATRRWWEQACASDGRIRLLPGAIVHLQRSGSSASDFGAPQAPGKGIANAALEASVRKSNPSAVVVHFSDNSWVSNKLIGLKRLGLALRDWAYQNWIFVELIFVLALALLLVAGIVVVRRLTRSHAQRIASLQRRLRKAFSRRREGRRSSTPA